MASGIGTVVISKINLFFSGKEKMKMLHPTRCFMAGLLLLVLAANVGASDRVVTDGAGRSVQVPEVVKRVICSGPGSLRLLTYLQADDMIVAVDDMEKQRPTFDARPYALANPQFKEYPIFGEFRGHDYPELILTLDPLPQVILKTYPGMGHDPVELQNKTGIPVVIVQYGELARNRTVLYNALRLIGEVVDRQQRAEEIISFFEERIADLQGRTNQIPPEKRPTCFVGGIAFKGPHGFQSTEPGYPPFAFIGAKNVATDELPAGKMIRQSNVAKEKIIQWNPDVLFLDLSTLQMGAAAGGLFELKTDPAYRTLSAVRAGKVYGLLPYNWYTRNFGSILANSYYIGKKLYPEFFKDIDPVQTADEIYTFLVGKPVFGEMSQSFDNLVFRPIPIK